MTEQDVLRAIQAYNREYPANDYPRSRPDQRSWLENDRYSQALDFQGRLYPPKKIYSIVIGEETANFNTAEAVRELRNAGFQVVAKPGAVR